MLGQGNDVHTALAQRRQQDAEAGQAVEKVLAKPSLARRGGKILARCSQDPDVQGLVAGAAQPANRPLLQRGQELGLQRYREGADLVEKESAPVGALKEPGLVLVGIGEGSSLKPKQLRLDQGVRDGRAVHCDERSARADAGEMDPTGKEAFSSAGLSEDEDRGQTAGSLLVEKQSADLDPDGRYPGAVSHQISQLLHWIGMLDPCQGAGKARGMTIRLRIAVTPAARRPR